MTNQDYLISTPENVDLHLELAGLGNRIMAAVVDRLITGAAIVAVVLGGLGVIVGAEYLPLTTVMKTNLTYYTIGLGLLLIFVIAFGYYIFFEGFWQGQTPGKRMAQIRVIEANGQPVGWSAVFIRNLLRIVDEMPGIYLGLLPMMFDKHERRFGDLAAGTLVIRERLQGISTSDLKIAALGGSGGVGGVAVGGGGADAQLVLDTGRISPEDYQLIVSFLRRREEMTQPAREKLAKELAEYLRGKVGAVGEGVEPAEGFVEKVYGAYRGRE